MIGTNTIANRGAAIQGFGFPQGLNGAQGFQNPNNGAANPAIHQLLGSVGSIPTGMPGTGNASFSQQGNPGFGGGGSEQMMRQFEQTMAMMMQFLGSQLANGQGAQGGSSGGGDGSGGGTAPISGGDASGGTAATGGTSASGGSAPANDSQDKGEIQSFIAEAAGVYGSDPKVLTEMARRESNFQTGVVNDWDSNAKKGTPSKGLFQFIEPTFKSYAAQAKKAKPEAWANLGELNWNDWRQQALTASWAVANGHGKAWSTYGASGGK